MAGIKAYLLHFYFQDGCSHCETARPAVQELAQQQPISGLLVLQHNCTYHAPRLPDGAELEATPTYVLAKGGGFTSYIGVLTKDQLRTFAETGETPDSTDADSTDADAAADADTDPGEFELNVEPTGDPGIDPELVTTDKKNDKRRKVRVRK